jgi:hypothetical protein
MRLWMPATADLYCQTVMCMWRSSIPTRRIALTTHSLTAIARRHTIDAAFYLVPLAPPTTEPTCVFFPDRCGTAAQLAASAPTSIPDDTTPQCRSHEQLLLLTTLTPTTTSGVRPNGRWTPMPPGGTRSPFSRSMILKLSDDKHCANAIMRRYPRHENTPQTTKGTRFRLRLCCVEGTGSGCLGEGIRVVRSTRLVAQFIACTAPSPHATDASVTSWTRIAMR